MLLTGKYEHQIDAKNRIRIPTKLKGNDDKVYFSKGTDGCIFVLFEDYVQEKVAILNNVRINDRDGQRGVRAFTNSLTPVEADTQGRLVIPSELITYANIKKDVTICGSGSRIEVWAKEVYEKYVAESQGFDEDISYLDMI